jgi:SAM-dependent methyltransferase
MRHDVSNSAQGVPVTQGYRGYDAFVTKRTKVRPGRVVPSVPNVARVYDYLLGGKDNFAIDRTCGEMFAAAVPGVESGVRRQRALLTRVVRYLTADAGIRQLLDIGAGLPSEENVHQTAQRVDPATRVAYVDNDPVVLAHARALLAENPAVAVAEGDLRDPAGIIGHPVVCAHLDWTRPIGLLLSGVMHQITDDERPARLTAQLIDALPPGSYVFIHHLLDLDNPAAVHLKHVMARAFGRAQFRTAAQVRELFCGLELVEPGLVLTGDWRPDGTDAGEERPALPGLACAGVARKP